MKRLAHRCIDCMGARSGDSDDLEEIVGIA